MIRKNWATSIQAFLQLSIYLNSRSLSFWVIGCSLWTKDGIWRCISAWELDTTWFSLKAHLAPACVFCRSLIISSSLVFWFECSTVSACRVKTSHSSRARIYQHIHAKWYEARSQLEISNLFHFIFSTIALSSLRYTGLKLPSYL